MREWDPTGKVGPRTPLPDVVTVLTPKVSRKFDWIAFKTGYVF